MNTRSVLGMGVAGVPLAGTASAESKLRAGMPKGADRRERSGAAVDSFWGACARLGSHGLFVGSLWAGLASAQVLPPEGHVEVALSGSPGAALGEDALARFLPVVRAPGFLEASALATDDPLAPCALVAAVVSSNLLNRLFCGLSQQCRLDDLLPPPGTKILGQYDAEFARRKGVVPRDDPPKTADMLGRLVVFRSWGVSAHLNTRMTTLTQGQCLAMLVHPEQLGKSLGTLDKSGIVMTHAAPVSAYIHSADPAEGWRWLQALPRAEMLDRPALPVDNPLAPCALVRAFRLAARVNDAWAYKLPAGQLETAGRAELAPYAQTLKKPLGVDGLDAGTAEALAAAMAAEISRANWLSTQLTARATQGECLNELFQPGGLRQKLTQSGVVLPSR